MKTFFESVAAFLKWVFIPRSPRELVIGAPLVVFLSMAGYLYFIDREPVITSRSQILTPVVAQGEFFQISYSIRWSSRCRITAYRFIVDGAGYRHERLVDTRYVQAGQDDFTISVRVPLGAAPGLAQYRGEIEYVCNVLQQLWPITRQLTVRQFEIVPGKPAARGLVLGGSVPDYSLVVD